MYADRGTARAAGFECHGIGEGLLLVGVVHNYI